MDGSIAQLIEKEADIMTLDIGFKRLSENAKLPTKANLTDSGLDLFAAEDVLISPGETKVIKTDLAVVLPVGYEAQVRPRSGITSKTKLRVQIGTIDESYRGNIGVIIDNIASELYIHGDYNYLAKLINGKRTRIDILTEGKPCDRGTYLIRKGDKIAQLVVQPIPRTAAVEITGEIEDSDRGVNGWGSSGV